MVTFISMKDIDKLKEELFIDEQIIRRCFSSKSTKFESYDGAMLITFDIYNVQKIAEEPNPISICILKEHLIFICELPEDAVGYAAWFERGALEKVLPLQGLYLFFDRLIKDDNSVLEEMEETIMDMEDDTITTGHKVSLADIINVRRKLLRIKKYYEQLNGIFEGILENDDNFLTSKALKYFKILDKKIDRLYAHTLNLRDYATQVREAYQAQVDITNNSLMKLFTVITAIFSPLTLIVGWYGMNLKMPEFGWSLGYPFVIILCVLVVLCCLLIFKKYKVL